MKALEVFFYFIVAALWSFFSILSWSSSIFASERSAYKTMCVCAVICFGRQQNIMICPAYARPTATASLSQITNFDPKSWQTDRQTDKAIVWRENRKSTYSLICYLNYANFSANSFLSHNTLLSYFGITLSFLIIKYSLY